MRAKGGSCSISSMSVRNFGLVLQQSFDKKASSIGNSSREGSNLIVLIASADQVNCRIILVEPHFSVSDRQNEER